MGVVEVDWVGDNQIIICERKLMLIIICETTFKVEI